MVCENSDGSDVDLPITMHDDFFSWIDDLVVAARWVLLGAAIFVATGAAAFFVFN
jgi:hypothetical protein